MPKTQKKKRPKKRTKADWYDSADDEGASEGSASSASSRAADGPRRAQPAVAQFAPAQQSPFEALVGSLMTTVDALPLPARQGRLPFAPMADPGDGPALHRVRQEQEGVEESEEEAAASDNEDVASHAEAPEHVVVDNAKHDDDDDADNDADNDADDACDVAEDDPFTARFAPLPPPARPVSEKLAAMVGGLALHGPAAPPRSRIGLKARLEKGWREYSAAMAARYPGEARDARGWTALQAALAPHVLGAYRDLAFCARTLANARALRELYVVHALNHALKARDLVDRHTRALREFDRQAHRRREAERALQRDPGNAALQEALGGLVGQRGPDAEAVRDQGFARPRVLLLLPRRNACLAAVTLMARLLGAAPASMERFLAEYGPVEEHGTESDLLDGSHPALKEDGGRHAPRPREWHAEFHGNADDEFKLGVSLSGGLKLFTDFHKSDIVIASPLGLRLATGLAMGAKPDAANGLNGGGGGDDGDDDDEEDDGRHGGKDDDGALDFLSSLELVVLDQADAFHMQNWQHVEDLARALNHRPQAMRADMDFSRVAHRFLDGWAHEFRQTLVFAPFPDALTNALLSRGGAGGLGLSRNYAGLVTVRPASYPPAVARRGLVQRFRRVDADDGQPVGDARLAHFASDVLPALQRQQHVLLFVPSYFDLLRVRKLLAAAEGLAFGVCSEYTPAKDVTRLRGDFFHGRLSLLVVSERFHYHFRYRLRGVHRLVFYAPPAHADFFAELAALARSPSGKDECLVLFDKSDALELERVAGTALARKMLRPGAPRDTAVE